MINHVYTLLILNDVVNLVHSIIILYFVSTEYQTFNISESQQIHSNNRQINLNYFTNWFLIKNSLITVLYLFHKKASILLIYSAFLIWMFFQLTSEYLDSSDSFWAEQKLHQFIISSLYQFKESVSSNSFIVKQNCLNKLILSEIHFQSSTFIKNIFHSLSLSQNMTDDNNSHHNNHEISAVTDSVFLKA